MIRQVRFSLAHFIFNDTIYVPLVFVFRSILVECYITTNYVLTFI